jgi:hypothetical protein
MKNTFLYTWQESKYSEFEQRNRNVKESFVWEFKQLDSCSHAKNSRPITRRLNGGDAAKIRAPGSLERGENYIYPEALSTKKNDLDRFN